MSVALGKSIRVCMSLRIVSTSRETLDKRVCSWVSMKQVYTLLHQQSQQGGREMSDLCGCISRSSREVIHLKKLIQCHNIVSQLENDYIFYF